MNLRDLLDTDGVVEMLELRGRFGFMAFHGGSLEERTDMIARAAAERAGASYYGVHQPAGLRQHVPSHRFTADQSELLANYLAHVDVVITVHGYGRRGLFTTMLLGGGNSNCTPPDRAAFTGLFGCKPRNSLGIFAMSSSTR